MGHSHQSLTTLLARARAGDSAAFVELCQPFRNEFLRVARQQLAGNLQRRADPDDVLQTTLMEAWRCFSTFEGNCDATWITWLRQVFNLQLRQYIRAQLAEKRAADQEGSIPAGTSFCIEQVVQADQTTPSEAAIRNERLEMIDRVVAELPLAEQQVLRRTKFESESHEDIANDMGRSTPAIRGLLHRAMSKLRQRLGTAEEPEDQKNHKK